MAGEGSGAIWLVAEPGPEGGLARISAEAATLARTLAGAAGRDVVGIVVAADPGAIATELATYLSRVWTIADPAAADFAWSAVAAGHVAALVEGDASGPDAILVGAGSDGRDLAGALSALTGLGVLTNATDVTWTERGPAVEMSVFGGKLLTTSVFTMGRGIITVRPNVVTAEPAAKPGTVEAASVPAPASEDAPLPAVRVIDRVTEAGAAAPIEEARIIVAGGRGVGGEQGFALVRDLAEVLGGAVGATRAAVDSGWIGYSQQIGQTGKIVKPELYLALGISGAIQHKVGMQTAGAIVAINRDPDAPIASFADLMVVGDLVAVGSALLEQLRSRTP
jgi:electron transfer flavoprotein alpha subunit